MKTYVEVSAAQAAEHDLHGPDHPLELSEVPVGAGAAQKEGVNLPMPTGN